MIDSLENKRIKDIIKLKEKKYRDQYGLFIVSTYHLVLEAYKSGCLVEIYKLADFDMDIDFPYTDVSLKVMKKITDLVNCKIIGVCKKKHFNKIVGDKILILDRIQDPGNLGTIFRSALAFNISCIVLSDDCCDMYNEKVVRASEGAIFNVSACIMDIKDSIKLLKSKNITILGTSVTNGINVSNVNENKYGLIMGNEGSGLSEEVLSLTDKNIYIKTNDLSESLNVAVATSIILYELNK